MTIIDTQEYVSMLRELTEQGKEVSMRISGNSMSPFLMHGRDSILLKKPGRKLKKGDMVFFQRKSGRFVMHRIVQVKKKGFYLLGDAQRWRDKEGPIDESQIFAVIVRVCRRGEWIGPGNFWWEFFEHIWIRIIPFRRLLIRFYRMGKWICESVRRLRKE
jgi:signal peptidase I